MGWGGGGVEGDGVEGGRGDEEESFGGGAVSPKV